MFDFENLFTHKELFEYQFLVKDSGQPKMLKTLKKRIRRVQQLEAFFDTEWGTVMFANPPYYLHDWLSDQFKSRYGDDRFSRWAEMRDFVRDAYVRSGIYGHIVNVEVFLRQNHLDFTSSLFGLVPMDLNHHSQLPKKDTPATKYTLQNPSHPQIETAVSLGVMPFMDSVAFKIY